MRIIYIGGNIGPGSPAHATENAYADAFRALGHEVEPVRQDALGAPATFLEDIALGEVALGAVGLVVYTRTHNNTALGPAWTEVWRALEARGTATIGLHLDVFVGLAEREQWVADGDPLFSTGTFFSPDGGSDDFWAAHRVNHRWLPPACDTRAIPADDLGDQALDGKIVFVGSEGYHDAWPHRAQLLDFLRRKYGPRFLRYGPGSPLGAHRDPYLTSIYNSDTIVVGDHCFADTRSYYWSDRVPETLGRGGLLVHPLAPGLRDWFGDAAAYYRPYAWADLEGTIAFLDSVGFAERERLRRRGRRRVLDGDPRPLEWSGPQIDVMPTEWRDEPDTYEQRARQILDVLGVAETNDDQTRQGG